MLGKIEPKNSKMFDVFACHVCSLLRMKGSFWAITHKGGIGNYSELTELQLSQHLCQGRQSKEKRFSVHHGANLQGLSMFSSLLILAMPTKMDFSTISFKAKRIRIKAIHQATHY